jgi:hypothetical protein
MNKFFLPLIVVLTSFCSKAPFSLIATWLGNYCGYTSGINLLRGDVYGGSICADNFGNSYNSRNYTGFCIGKGAIQQRHGGLVLDNDGRTLLEEDLINNNMIDVANLQNGNFFLKAFDSKNNIF